MERFFYRDPATSIVWEFEKQQVDDGLVPETFIRMTAAEVELHINPPPTPEEVEIMRRAELLEKSKLAASQKSALTNRISELNDAIEYEMATPEEISELPVRVAQRVSWGQYAVLLGRVTSQQGWYDSVDWPIQPKEGMDLSISPAVRV